VQYTVLANTLDMPRAEWLDNRRRGIGGSDAAAIMGANPYKSPLSVYADKLGIAGGNGETNEAMRQGIDFEDYVARRFMEATGRKVHRVNQLLQSTEYPFMLANIDRKIIGDDAGLECKTTNAYKENGIAAGELPQHYIWQCMHYMAVTGAPVWYVAVLVLGRSFHVFQIDRDEEKIAQLIAAERDFWEGHVVPRIPPLPTGTDSDNDVLEEMYPGDPDEPEIDVSDISGEFDLLSLLERDKDDIEQKIMQHKQIIKQRMGDAEKGACARWAASYKGETRTTLDSKRIKAERPEIYQQYGKQITSRVLRVKEIKGEKANAK
jgi:putative phage-type endonuclease